ncbi:hypothetical protein VCHENC03_2864B, partial [Vibrio sp. HENC-03]
TKRAHHIGAPFSQI